MSLPVFLLDAPIPGEPPRTVELTGPEGRHAVTVKRITPGEHVELVDGAGAVSYTHLTLPTICSV